MMIPEKIWRVRCVSIEGGDAIGRTWGEWFYVDEAVARCYLDTTVKQLNDRELSRTEEFCLREREWAAENGRPWGRLFVRDCVDGVHGWCNWQYGTMYVLDEIIVHRESGGGDNV